MLPAAGSRYLVPVVSGVQRFFQNLSTFFSFGIPIENQSPTSLFLEPGVSFRGQSKWDRDALRPLLSTAAVEGRRRGRGYMVDPIGPGKFFRSSLIDFSILSTSCG